MPTTDEFVPLDTSLNTQIISIAETSTHAQAAEILSAIAGIVRHRCDVLHHLGLDNHTGLPRTQAMSQIKVAFGPRRLIEAAPGLQRLDTRAGELTSLLDAIAADGDRVNVVLIDVKMAGR